MYICSYNVRGLNKKSKQTYIKDFLSFRKVSLVGLLETRVKDSKADPISRFVGNHWNWLFNYQHHNNGRIWVGWDAQVWDVTLVASSDQLMHCHVSSIDRVSSFYITFVYAHNDEVARCALWRMLSSFSIASPWCLLGDFNVVRTTSEMLGGDVSWDNGMHDFNTCISSLGLEDLRAVGSHLTWTNCQLDNPILRKLDRALVNSDWMLSMADSQVNFASRGLSDHCPIILQTGISFPKVKKPFKFFNYMLEVEGFQEVLDSVWYSHYDGNPFTVFSSKLKKLKGALSSFNRSNGNLSSNVAVARDALHDVQVSLQSDPLNSNLMALESDCMSQLWKALDLEESLLLQKSRQTWLSQGDRNSAFFAASVKSRWNANKILSIADGNGDVVEGQDAIESIAVDYFQGILGADQFPFHGHDVLNAVIAPAVSPQAASMLIAPISNEEIFSTLSSMKKNKSPGPDGFNVNFFLACWNTVGEDFLNAAHYFFKTWRMPSGLNSTAITLVPKVDVPSSMAHFRPISCCNTFYKCISKLLANRLKNTLPNLIGDYQSAFVAGRSISDNILLAQELFKGYHSNHGPPKCALKIDLRKAFDSVNWEFLFHSMACLGFPKLFLIWLKACICSPMFSVKINDAMAGYFKGTQGLRQGDPLSPYLFVIVMEVLSLMIKKAASNTSFKYHWRTKDVGITHLCFADDLIVFCHGDLNSVSLLYNALQEFSSISGLQINSSKSHCFLSNVSPLVEEQILNLLSFPKGSLPMRFLGVPLITSKLKHQDCQPLMQRIVAKVHSWTSRFLSYAGRLQLIKTVLFSIQSYWSMHFILPKRVLKELQSILSAFLWKGPSLARFGARVAWSTICHPLEEGGLGVKDLVEWNNSLIIHHLLKVINLNSSSVWANWVRCILLRKHNFWEAPIPTSCSWIWRKVLNLRNVALPHLHYHLGNGCSFNLWFDPWLPSGPINPSSCLLSNSGLSKQALVSSIIVNGSWAPPQGNHVDLIELRHLISYAPSPSTRDDHITWGSFDISRIKAAHIWHSIRHQAPKPPWAHLVWSKLLVPRYAFILWLAMHRKLPFRNVTKHYAPNAPSDCPFCGALDEDHDHLFFTCSYTRDVFHGVFYFAGAFALPLVWEDLLHSLMEFSGSAMHFHLLKLLLSTLVYKIWLSRNKKIHEDVLVPPSVLVKDIVSLVKARVLASPKFIKSASNCNILSRWLG